MGGENVNVYDLLVRVTEGLGETRVKNSKHWDWKRKFEKGEGHYRSFWLVTGEYDNFRASYYAILWFVEFVVFSLYLLFEWTAWFNCCFLPHSLLQEFVFAVLNCTGVYGLTGLNLLNLWPHLTSVVRCGLWYLWPHPAVIQHNNIVPCYISAAQCVENYVVKDCETGCSYSLKLK